MTYNLSIDKDPVTRNLGEEVGTLQPFILHNFVIEFKEHSLLGFHHDNTLYYIHKGELCWEPLSANAHRRVMLVEINRVKVQESPIIETTYVNHLLTVSKQHSEERRFENVSYGGAFLLRVNDTPRLAFKINTSKLFTLSETGTIFTWHLFDSFSNAFPGNQRVKPLTISDVKVSYI
jgi:hypothetical protein